MGLLGSIGKVFSAISPIGAVASGVGSLISGISGAKAQKEANETNLQIARENNDTSVQIARENNEFAKQHAIDMFNMENVYNTPLAQMERYRDAGLNPAVMMEGAGGAASGNSSGAGMVSPSMPSLTTPHVEAVPPMAVGFLDALSSFSQIKLANAQTSKAGAEENRINMLLDEEIMNMIADRNWKEAQTDYQNLMTRFEELYGHDRRAAEIQKTISEFLKNKMQGNEAAARAALVKAEEQLVKSKDNQLKLESPLLIENLKKLGVKLDEEVKTEKSKQSANYASASRDSAAASLTRSQKRLLDDQHDDLVRAQKAQADHSEQSLKEAVQSMAWRMEKLYNEGLLSKAQWLQAEEALKLAEKENDWYHWNQAFEKIERTNRAVNSWFSITNY